jgi:hypothetical protein
LQPPHALTSVSGLASAVLASPAFAGNTNPAQFSYGGLSRKTGNAVR